MNVLRLMVHIVHSNDAKRNSIKSKYVTKSNDSKSFGCTKINGTQINDAKRNGIKSISIYVE